MLDALGHDIHLPRPERDRSIAKLDIQLSLQDQKEIIGIVVLVPDKFAFMTMTSQSLNCVTVRDDQCSENVDSFSDKSMALLINGP